MIVIKVGGGAGIRMDPLVADVAARVRSGERVVLVHGASDETNRLQESLGEPARFVTSVSGHVSRFTDAAALDAFAMASGKLNLRWVEALQKSGVNAVGLTGVDGRMLEGSRKDHVKALVDGKKVILRGDHTGTVERVNASLLRLLLDAGYTPVLTVPAISYEGDAVNADADRAAAAVAGALGAATLVILTNVRGLLRDPADPGTLIRDVVAEELAHAASFAQGRFKKKIMGAQEALTTGVDRVIFANANAAAPITGALSGEGTTIHRAATPQLEATAWP